MSCDAFESMIALDAGGDLPAAAAEEIARHLAACGACRRSILRLQASSRAFDASAIENERPVASATSASTTEPSTCRPSGAVSISQR